MMSKKIPQHCDREEGYVLLAVIFLTVLVLVSLAIAAPKVAMSIQRDKERETVHRGQQYKRAIKLYYQKFGRYPTSIDQLVETNQIRFLRKRYLDPLTGKDDWKPVFFGQAHVRPLGFFGQPLMMAAGLGGVGSSMYAATTTATTTDANGVPIAAPDSSSATSGFGGTSSGFGGTAQSGNNSGFGSSNSGFGSSSSGFGSTGAGSSNGISSMFNSSSSSSGFGSSNSSTPGAPGSNNGTGTSAATFGGGGPIVGFTLPVDKPSLILYKQQTRYNKWEFNYDPAEDQAQALAGLTGGSTNVNGTQGSGTPGFGNNPGQLSPGQIPPTPTPTPVPSPTGPPSDPTAPQ